MTARMTGNDEDAVDLDILLAPYQATRKPSLMRRPRSGLVWTAPDDDVIDLAALEQAMGWNRV